MADSDTARDRVLATLRGIGATLQVTDQRLVLARDGAGHRPASGVQTWRLEAIRQIAIESGLGTSGRVVAWGVDGREAVSLFFDARSAAAAHELLDAARPRIARERRLRARAARGR